MSVLDMFMGGVSCPHGGHVAAEALEDFVENAQRDEGLPKMPRGMAEVLEKCFARDRAARWGTLADVVELLAGIYRSAFGADHNTALSRIQQHAARREGIGERRTREGATWIVPQEWVERALRAKGCDPAEAAAIVAGQGASRRGQFVADLAAYDAAHRICERLVNQERRIELADKLGDL